MALQSGTRLGPYEVIGLIGAGGMGEVYRATDTRLGRDVAVKVLPEEFARDRDRLRRFEVEARATAALSHPNIVTVYDVGAQTEGLSYVVTEFLQGETLRKRLERGALAVEQVVDLAGQIAAGLSAAHERGIVHRDLKPENIFIVRSGEPKILDFGLARITKSPESSGELSTFLTQPGSVLGTTGYMSPEQVRGYETDHRSDIFSFGAIIYEMVTGQRAFQGNSQVDTITAILKEDPPEATAGRAPAPPALARIIECCLQKEATQRFQSTRDLKAALEAISGLVPIRRAKPAKVRETPERSIAVLPFTNMSAGADQEYFSDGLAEELINALTRLPGLRVAARTSAFRFRARDLDIREIGRQLNVETILEGSVRRSGDRIRITAQLVSVDEGYQLWSQRYDRQVDDLFAIQDDITEQIVKTVAPTLLGKSQLLPRRETENVEAFDLYLKGRHLWYQRTKGALSEAIDYFQRAIQLDPNYTLAYAGLADSFAFLRINGFISKQEGKPAAEAAVSRAMALDPALAESHFARALHTLIYTSEWPSAGPHLQKALEIDPRSSMMLVYNGLFLAARHQPEEAASCVAKGVDVDPLSPFVHAVGSLAMYVARRYQRALELAERALELQPDFALGLWSVALASSKLRRYDRAIEACERLVIVSKRAVLFVGVLGFVYGLANRRKDAQGLLDELSQRAGQEYIYPYSTLLIHFALGDHENTHKQLTACLDDHVSGFGICFLGPYLDELAEPRFIDLLRRFHLLGGAQPLAV